MTKPIIFLAALPIAGLSLDARAANVQPGTHTELAACLAITLVALVLAYIGMRRSAALDERARSLQGQLEAEREARHQSDQALAANHDVLCRMVRQHEGVRDGERSRIARDLQAELGRRLASLRNDLSHLVDNATPAQSAFSSRLDGALANVDGAITAVRAVTGGLRGFGPADGLRHALERNLAEHAQLHGLRYRFEAGVDPAAHPSSRAARLAVFGVLQEVLAMTGGRAGGAELHVRLSEGACALALDIQLGATVQVEQVEQVEQVRINGGQALSEQLADRVRALGGALRVAAAPGRPCHWSLSLPVREPAEAH